MTNLVTALTEVATAAIAPARLRGLVIELKIANNGAVVEGRAWIEHTLRSMKGGQG